MQKQNSMKKGGFFFCLCLSMIFLLSCGEKKSDQKSQQSLVPSHHSGVKKIQSIEQFKNLVESSGDRLLVFDLYADWCRPCRILSPMLEEIAQEQGNHASFYKVDIEKHGEIGRMFNARSIPLVVFLKNTKLVHSLVGLQAKNIYMDAINKYSQSGT